MTLLIVGIVAALLLSALLNAVELALFSLSDARIQMLQNRRFEGADALERLRARPQRMLILLRLSSTAMNVAAATLSALVALRLDGGIALLLGAMLVALLLVYLAQLLPMRLITGRQVELALGTAPAVAALVSLFGPLLGFFGRIVRVVPIPDAPSSGRLSDNEVRQITALGEREGLVDDHERALIDRVFSMSETRVWDIMTPRVDVFAWSDSLLLRQIATQLYSVPYSRVPVYGEGIDDVTGVLYVRDAYQALVSGQRDVPLRQLARQPLLVPGSMPLVVLLREFQTRRIHVAIVVDEYSGTDGLVTLEDVLEELVGEIVDETDIPDEPILRLSRTEIVAAGDADLREINHFFNTALPQLEHRSLNGYLLEELGRVPDSGEQLERDGVRVEVLEATETQVVRARLTRTAAPQPERPEAEERAPAD